MYSKFYAPVDFYNRALRVNLRSMVWSAPYANAGDIRKYVNAYKVAVSTIQSAWWTRLVAVISHVSHPFWSIPSESDDSEASR